MNFYCNCVTTKLTDFIRSQKENFLTLVLDASFRSRLFSIFNAAISLPTKQSSKLLYCFYLQCYLYKINDPLKNSVVGLSETVK